MSFNPDQNKQATEVVFSRKRNTNIHPRLSFNGSHVAVESSQKHLGLLLDEKLNFKPHIALKKPKAMKGIGLIRRMYHYLPRKALLTIYTSYIRPYLD